MIWAAMTLAFFGFLRLGELTCNSKFNKDVHLTQRRSDKQLACCHVSSRPIRSLYFPSCFLQNLGRKICIRRKINREKTLILKFSCKISSVVVLLLKIW
jgi:hypothetical protein